MCIRDREYTAQLAENPSDYSNVIRSTGSTQQYVDLFYTDKALPADVVARLDSVKVGGCLLYTSPNW